MRIFVSHKRPKNNMTTTLHIAIVGGGAAGFFAAIATKRQNPDAEVTIFEKLSKVLAKVEITGGGRCNLTNTFADIADASQAYPRGHKLMKRLFRRFNHRDAHSWFEDHGVPLVIQEDQCVFPQSQDAMSVVNCLTSTALSLGVKIKTRHTLTGMERQEDGKLQLIFKTDGNVRTLVFDRVAITTGGSPRPEGLRHLVDLGHEVEHPVPSLFTFNIADKKFKQLMGTVVDPVTVSIPATKWRATGALLITHWGMSGPAVLKLSSHAARHLHDNAYVHPMAVNWINETNRATVETQLHAIIDHNPQKQLSSIRPYDLPSRLWTYLIEKTGYTADKRWGELGKKGCNQLIETLTNDHYDISGKGTFKEEFVTCGGIALSNVNPHTLESKVCPHLFFAGEVLDIDAITGGFNLQAAWTTGYVVGQHIAE